MHVSSHAQPWKRNAALGNSAWNQESINPGCAYTNENNDPIPTLANKQPTTSPNSMVLICYLIQEERDKSSPSRLMAKTKTYEIRIRNVSSLIKGIPLDIVTMLWRVSDTGRLALCCALMFMATFRTAVHRSKLCKRVQSEEFHPDEERAPT